MKKGLPGTLALAVCSLFIFAGCAPAAQPAPSVSAGDDLILAVAGTVTDITNADGTTSITVDGSNTQTDATYQSMILHTTDKTPVEKDGTTGTYTEGAIGIGDTVEAYFSASAPITASEPPQGTPDKIVVTAQAGEAGSADMQKEFDGTITEISKDNDYLLVYVQNEEGGDAVNDLRAVVSADTAISSESDPDKALTMEDLAKGQKVTVTTDGRMTFSIPPQANAQAIVLHDAQAK